MNIFTRFILWLVLLGFTMTLGIVLTANWHSARRQAHDLAQERARIKQILTSQPHFGWAQAQFGVKYKELGPDGQAVRTTIVWRWRPYALDPGAGNVPMQEFTFAGDRLAIDAVVLTFQRFGGTEDESSLQGTTIAYAAHIYPPDAKPADHINLTPEGGGPIVFRHDPLHVSQAEAILWHDIAELIRSPALAEREGLEIHRPEPASSSVQLGTLYEVVVQKKDSATLAGYADYVVKIVVRDDKGSDLREMLYPPKPEPVPH